MRPWKSHPRTQMGVCRHHVSHKDENRRNISGDTEGVHRQTQYRRYKGVLKLLIMVMLVALMSSPAQLI